MISRPICDRTSEKVHVFKNTELRKRQNCPLDHKMKKNSLVHKWYLGPFSYLSLKYEVINTFPKATVTVETKVTFLVLPRERLQDSVILEHGGKTLGNCCPATHLEVAGPEYA